MMKSIALLASVLALTACQSGGVGMAESPAWFATASQEQQMAYFSKRCGAYGFKPGTNEMAQCLMTESQSSRGRANVRSAMSSRAIANSAPRTITTNCSQNYNRISCSSY